MEHEQMKIGKAYEFNDEEYGKDVWILEEIKKANNLEPIIYEYHFRNIRTHEYGIISSFQLKKLNVF